MVGEPQGHAFTSHPGPADTSRFAHSSFADSTAQVLEPALVLAGRLWRAEPAYVACCTS